jgi:hypothetical protein
MKKNYLSLILCFYTILGNCCEGNFQKEYSRSSKNIKTDRSRLFGMGFPAYLRYTEDGIDYKKSFELMEALGVKAWRSWIHATTFLKDPETPNPQTVNIMKDILKEAGKYDFETIGMNHVWFNGGDDGISVPQRDLSEGSVYVKFLNDYEKSWETLAMTFPEVKKWEVGNEWNHDPFLHPMDYRSSGLKSVFTLDEKADITTDMLYYASRGIHKANPNAEVILGGLAPVYKGKMTIAGIAVFLNLVYENISSGQWPSRNTDDYFQALCWHPYTFRHECGFHEPDEKWVALNNLVHQVAVAYGDGEKEVYFTEWGFSEKGNTEQEKLMADWIVKGYELVKEKMPYVRTMHYFRLYEDEKANKERKTADWGGAVEVYYGMFVEPHNGWKPKTKAVKYQQIAGGKGNIWKYANEDKPTLKKM